MPIKYREAHKKLLSNGWQLNMKGGKGSHRKYKKDGRMFPLPYHGDNKELSHSVEKQLKNLLETDGKK